MPNSGGSPGMAMLSVLPPPRSLVIRAPPLSMPNGKRKRDGSFPLDENSPKSGGSSPNAQWVPKPNILNRPKSCPSNGSKFEGLDNTVFQGRSPVLGTPGQSDLQSSAVLSNPALKGHFSVRSASPNTLHVATALSLLCGLGTNKSPTEISPSPNCKAIPSGTNRLSSSLLPTSSPVLVPSALISSAVMGRPHSESLGDRMDVTSEEDYCEISPKIDVENDNPKTRIVNVDPMYDDNKCGVMGTPAPAVVNFDQLSASDGAISIGDSALNAWASPAVQTDRLSSWAQPAVSIPRTPSESGLLFAVSRDSPAYLEVVRTRTPVEH